MSKVKKLSQVKPSQAMIVVWWVKYDTQVDTMMPYMMTSSVPHPLNFH